MSISDRTHHRTHLRTHHPITRLIASAALALAALAALATPIASSAQAALKVENPWARPTVSGQAAGGGYLRLVGGAAGDKLVAARSDIAARVELHSMSMDGNIMRMRQIDAINVPAGQTVDLKPGGLHLMFMDLKAPLAAGSQFALTLQFEKAGEVKVDVKVQNAAPGMKADAKSEPMHDHKHEKKHDHKH